MNITSTFACSSALAALLLVAPPLLAFDGAVPAAQAAVSVSVNLFFDELAPHGDWVSHRGAYVFVPARLERGWRPYTHGRWVYSDDYGWIWASDEAFGWATYHYGRWGYGDDIGWYWVPGTRWAPAWVSWRRSADHVVWAPLPPDRDNDVSINVSIGSIPDFYWVAVPRSNFLAIDLRVRIIDNDRDRRRIVQRSEPAGSVRIRNNIVVNNVIDVKVVERETGRKVPRVRVRETDNPREARAGDDEVAVFNGRIERQPDAKPKQVSDIEDVKRKRPRGEQADQQPADAEPGQDTATGEDAATPQPGKPARKRQNAEQPADKESQDTATGEDAATPQPGKPARKRQNAEQPVTDDDDLQTGSTSRPKKAVPEEEVVKKQTGQEAVDSEEPAKKQNRKKPQQAEERKAKERPAEANQKQRKNDGKKAKCNPETDPDCQS